jgi:hypothetical protein
VESYADQFLAFPSNYILATVLAAEAGLVVELRLVTGKDKFPKVITLGPADMDDLEKLKAKIQYVPIVFEAMVKGFSPADLVYVSCFKTGQPDNSLLEIIREDVTLGLPSALTDTALTQSHWPHGMESGEFNRHCVDPKQDLDTQFFNYIIEGVVLPFGGGAESVQVLVRVHRREPTERFGLNPPELKRTSAVKDLARLVAGCWGRWGEEGCE